MKNNTLVSVSRGRLAGYQGYAREPHANMPGWFWCYLSKEAPYPEPYQKPGKHHVEKVLPIDQLQIIQK